MIQVESDNKDQFSYQFLTRLTLKKVNPSDLDIALHELDMSMCSVL